MAGLITYARNVGEALDRFLNTVVLAGAYDQTISLHSAQAAKTGRVWGCALCRWLSWTVETDHCPKVLADENVSNVAGLKALLQLVALGTVAFAGWYLLLWRIAALGGL